MQNLARAGAKQRRSFLATANGTLDVSDLGDDLALVIAWFQNNLRLVGPSTSFAPLGDFLERNPGFREFASTFLRETSTGVDHLSVVTQLIPRDEVSRLIPEPKFEEVTVQAEHRHNGRQERLLLRDESDGTRRLLDLLPAIQHVRSRDACAFR